MAARTTMVQAGRHRIEANVFGLSTLREWFTFRGLTAADRPLAPGALGDKPLMVVTRADGGPYGGRQWQLWHGFHAEQAQLSANSRHVLSGHADHALNESDPDLVTAAIREVVRSAHRRRAGRANRSRCTARVVRGCAGSPRRI